jgi:cation transport protein ChaC
MWDPCFPFVERRRGLLRGYHRRFCIYSVRHRGTPERPGLVFGLDHGGACRGLVFRVAGAEVPATLEALWSREMAGYVYRPRLLPVQCDGGGPTVAACAFVVDRGHAQYCRGLDLAAAAAVIRHGVGGRGRNLDYLVNTVTHLEQLGIVDRGLQALLTAVGREPPSDPASDADRA